MIEVLLYGLGVLVALLLVTLYLHLDNITVFPEDYLMAGLLALIWPVALVVAVLWGLAWVLGKLAEKVAQRIQDG